MPVLDVKPGDLEDMATEVTNAANHIAQQTIPVAQKVLNTMHNGGWEGKAAEVFTGGLMQHFIPDLNKLHDKLVEVAKDIRDSLRTAQEEDQRGARGFRS
jgi:WXG100 family type VII secretion target